MDPTKIETVVKWEPLKHLKDVQTFLRFANFYRPFVRLYSSIVAPLTELTKKNVTFRCTDPKIKAFQSLKNAFTSAPILRHFDPDKEYVVETDESDYVSAGILLQIADCNNPNPDHPYYTPYSCPSPLPVRNPLLVISLTLVPTSTSYYFSFGSERDPN